MTEAPKKPVKLKVKPTVPQPITTSAAAKRLYGATDKPATKK